MKHLGKNWRKLGRVSVCLLALIPTFLYAGGGAFNTLVVVNTQSADSVELGDYYAAAYDIPAHHICPLSIPTNTVSVSSNQLASLLLTPIRNHIASNQLTGQIDYVVLCGDIPTRVNMREGLSASLFYGFKNAPGYHDAPVSCKLPEYTSNAYYRAERAFRSADGWSGTNGFITFHLIAFDLATAKEVVDRGRTSQSTFPNAGMYLYHLGDAHRGVRERFFANAQFSFTALPGLPATCTIGPYYTAISGRTNVIGYHDGYGTISAAIRTNNTWLPGAYADHMTSCGGMIPDPCYGQSTILDWMHIGATASFGTVAEPCSYYSKFPDPLMAFYYARGFTIGESYAMSVFAPYEGLFAGDPLAAPFAAPPVIAITSPAPHQIVSGTLQLNPTATPHSRGVPARSLDLYLNGRWRAALTNLTPTPGNELSVVINNRTNTVTVAPGDTLCNVVSNLADAVNADTPCIAFARPWGDRLELIYKNFDLAGNHLPVSAFAATGSASVLTLGTGLAATNLHPSTYPARKRLFLYGHTNGVSTNVANAGDTITLTITLTNGVAVTNHFIATAGQTIRSLIEQIQFAINTNPVLKASNGIRFAYLANGIGNVLNDGTLLARTNGPDGQAIRVDFTITPVSTNSGFSTNSNFSSQLDDNAYDLLPRASILFHVRPENAILTTTATLDTTQLPDGPHTLDFIARDGTAVAAQSRHTLPVIVANTTLVLRVHTTPHGTPTPPPGITLHPPNATITNTVTPPPPADGTQYACTGWTLLGNAPPAGTGATAIITLTNHAELTWHWTTNHWLATTAAPHDTGAVTPAPSWQPANATIHVTATPAPYHHFTHWTGTIATTTNNPLPLHMNAPHNLQATFAPNLAANQTPEWWLAAHGWTNNFDAAALADPDTDGYPTWQEYIADTDPNDPQSHPRLTHIDLLTDPDTRPILLWPASTARTYTIEYTDDLLTGTWTTQHLNLGASQWTDTNPPPLTNRTYRLSPRLPP
ncbi:MAG: TIGR03790 family protein [Kiritimatiellia bacterium]